MNKTFKRISASLFIALFILSISFIKSSTNEFGTVQAASYEWGTVKVSAGDRLYIRAAASSNAKVLVSYTSGKRVKIAPETLKQTWVKVSAGGFTGWAYGKYIETAYGTASQPYKYVKSGVTNAQAVVRTSAAHTASAVVIIPKGKSLQVLTKEATWVKVKYDGKTGYTVGTRINVASTGKTASGTKQPETATAPTSSYAKGQAIIDYAKLFVGNRYVYGGNSLTNGTDCSGFVHLIYQHFGYTVARQSYALRFDGVAVPSLSQAQPGDIICYDGHVALYIGNGQIVHASNSAPYPQGGIKISPDATYRSIITIRRIVK